MEDERTRMDSVSPTFDKPPEDVALLVLRGPDVGKRFLVKPPGGVLGRQPDCAIQIHDPNISRRHALLEFAASGRVMLVDLGSKNGVHVNGVRISRAELFDGNNIQLSSDTVVRVRFQDPAETELLDELQGAVVQDQLTGLPNRRYLTTRLAQELSYARRHREPLSLTMIDVDDFHKINDADGQEGGDALLKALALLVRKSARLEDVVVRYGGDQLVMVLRATKIEQAEISALRVAELIRKRVFKVGDVPTRVSVSAGMASYEPGRFEIEGELQPATGAPSMVHTLLDRADTALFRAKSAGKDKVVRWEQDEEPSPTQDGPRP
jgi:diguanylate cyclase (GGDEF)-like protein